MKNVYTRVEDDIDIVLFFDDHPAPRVSKKNLPQWTVSHRFIATLNCQ